MQPELLVVLRYISHCHQDFSCDEHEERCCLLYDMSDVQCWNEDFLCAIPVGSYVNNQTSHELAQDIQGHPDGKDLNGVHDL